MRAALQFVSLLAAASLLASHAQAEDGGEPLLSTPAAIAPVEAAPSPIEPSRAEQPAPTAAPELMPEVSAVETIPQQIEAALGSAGGPIADFYRARGFAPLWIENGAFTSKAEAAMARIRRADEDGLDAAAYVLPTAADVDGELALSRSAIAFARQASGGRIDPLRVGPLITAKPPIPAPADVLAALDTAADAADVLDGYNPPHLGFKRLKALLGKLRREGGMAKSDLPEIPAGRLLRPGKSDPRVPLLRARMALPANDSPVYDEELVAAVQGFQAGKGLNADGVIGQQTVITLNGGGSPATSIPLILANMERWRWLPRELGATHVFVNIPEFTGRIFRNGPVVHETRVITGSVKNQTPIFSDQMEHIIVNPAWNVPYSIASKEMLPMLQKDPSYLERQGIEALYVGGKRAQRIDSTMIDWSTVNMKQIRFRQPPGERNALGHIKFMFPNEHSVYLHDTSSRSLFSKEVRALSHGCVRVQDPFALADVLLEGSAWNAARMKKLIGGDERRIDLAHKVPIHIAYFTAIVGVDGTLSTRADIYGHDKKLEALLALDGPVQAKNDRR